MGELSELFDETEPDNVTGAGLGAELGADVSGIGVKGVKFDGLWDWELQAD